MGEGRRLATAVLGALGALLVLLAAANVVTVVVDRRVRSLPEELLRVLNLNVESSLGPCRGSRAGGCCWPWSSS